jgi:hypothetical protein
MKAQTELESRESQIKVLELLTNDPRAIGNPVKRSRLNDMIVTLAQIKGLEFLNEDL